MPKKNKAAVALLLICCSIAVQSVSGVTIPAGTMLLVRTNQIIDSSDPVGKKFEAQLYQGVVADGKVLLPAGTPVIGRVDASRVWAFDPVILNVTHLVSGGRFVPISTTQGFQADGSRFKTRRGIGVGSGGFFMLPVGTQMQFRLAKPVDLGGSKAGTAPKKSR